MYPYISDQLFLIFNYFIFNSSLFQCFIALYPCAFSPLSHIYVLLPFPEFVLSKNKLVREDKIRESR